MSVTATVLYCTARRFESCARVLQPSTAVYIKSLQPPTPPQPQPVRAQTLQFLLNIFRVVLLPQRQHPVLPTSRLDKVAVLLRFNGSMAQRGSQVAMSSSCLF